MKISNQINYNYSNKSNYYKKQNKPATFKSNSVLKTAETTTINNKFNSILKKGVLTLVSFLTVATGFAKTNNTDIDIYSKEVEQLKLSKEQIEELDKLDGQKNKKIGKDILKIAKAYKDGKFKIGSKSRTNLLKKMKPQEYATFNLLSKPQIVKDENGNIITEYIDADCDGKAEYIEEYQYDSNNNLINVTSKNAD